jgi:hypothetical protein
MIRIENKQRGPVQLVVRSKVHNGGFTTLNIPGMGAGLNFYDLEDELMTEQIDRVKKDGFITTKYINTVTEGE